MCKLAKHSFSHFPFTPTHTPPPYLHYSQRFLFLYSLYTSVLHTHNIPIQAHTHTAREAATHIDAAQSTHVWPGNGNENSAKNNNSNKKHTKHREQEEQAELQAALQLPSPRRRPVCVCLCVHVCVRGTGKAAKITAQQTTLMSNSDNRTTGQGWQLDGGKVGTQR